MTVRYSLGRLGFISDWLLPVDVGELLLSEPCKYLGVSLYSSVYWCWEYICSAFGAHNMDCRTCMCSIQKHLNIRYAFTLPSEYEKKKKKSIVSAMHFSYFIKKKGNISSSNI